MPAEQSTGREEPRMNHPLLSCPKPARPAPWGPQPSRAQGLQEEDKENWATDKGNPKAMEITEVQSYALVSGWHPLLKRDPHGDGGGGGLSSQVS